MRKAVKSWGGKSKAKKKRDRYAAQRGLCARCLMPWPIEELRFHFADTEDKDDRTFDLRCGSCKENPPERVSFRDPSRWAYTGRRQG